MGNNDVSVLSGADNSRAHRSAWGPAVFLGVVFLVYVPYFVAFGYGYLAADAWDLRTFYAASVVAFDRGCSPYIKDCLEAVMSERPMFPYLYTPPCLLLFYPFSRVSYDFARIALLVLNHVLVLLAAYVIPVHLLGLSLRRNPWRACAAALYVFMFCAIIYAIQRGQVDIITLAALVAFWLLVRNGNVIGAGFFLSVAILLKLYPAGLIFFLVMTRRYRTAGAAIAWIAAWSLATLLILPADIWHDWITRVILNVVYGREWQGQAGLAAALNENVNGFFERRFLLKTFCTQPWLVSPRLHMICAYSCSTVLLSMGVFAAWQVNRRDNKTALDLSLFLALPLIFLVAPRSFEYHLIHSLPSFLAILAARCHGTRLHAVSYHLLAGATLFFLSFPFLPWGFDIRFLAVLSAFGLLLYSVLSDKVQLLHQHIPVADHPQVNTAKQVSPSAAEAI